MKRGSLQRTLAVPPQEPLPPGSSYRSPVGHHKCLPHPAVPRYPEGVGVSDRRRPSPAEPGVNDLIAANTSGDVTWRGKLNESVVTSDPQAPEGASDGGKRV